MTLRRLVGCLCLVAAATACSGSHDSAQTPTTFHPTTTLSLRPLLGTELMRAGGCPADTVPAVVPGTCYRVGPAFITQADIETADATYDETIGQWVVAARVAKSARARYLDQMHARVNQEIAIEIDDRVVSQVRINPGVSGSGFEIASHETWSMTKAIETAAGIAKPSRPACTARTCPTSTTGETDKVAARCGRIAPALGYENGMSSGQVINAARLRAAFVRAHEKVPQALVRINASELLALCGFSRLSGPGQATPTTTCPNGVSMIATTDFAVDEHLHVIPHVPAARYLYPDLQLSGFGPCDVVSSGP